MAAAAKTADTLRFIFTEDGFYCDNSGELSEAEETLRQKFLADRWAALFHWGAEQRPEGLSASAGFLYLLSDAFYKQLTDLPDLELTREKTEVTLSDPDRLLQAVPFGIGVEYIDTGWLERAFARMNGVFCREVAAYEGTVALYLAEQNQNLKVPERVFFHLVENKDEDFPFAFLATYATTDESGRVRHYPLQYALKEYRDDREKLINLLSCLNRAAQVCRLIGSFMESGELFHPLQLTAKEAYDFLTHVEAIEAEGILCRVPNWWKKRTAAVSLSIRLGEDRPSLLGFDSLISVQPQLMVDGVPLTEEEIRDLLNQTEGLAFLKGKWVEVDHDRLRTLLSEMDGMPEKLTLMEALRMETVKPKADVGELVTNGAWLSSLLSGMKQPESLRAAALPKSVHATLRPYQKTGYTWLNYMGNLGFGACLADDMGLGKTVQMLASLEKLRCQKKDARALLIVPASLLGNWKKEIERFTPQMTFQILHGKTAPLLEEQLSASDAFLTVTTYGMAMRMQALQKIPWDCLILDEAQAIKNPLTKQTREIKKIPGRIRVAMTGTPIENDLTNLWSLFDFLNKGLLGTSQEFRNFCKGLENNPDGYARLKGLVSPFMLRRVKTDKRVIADLPEKMEMVDRVELTRKQAVLYRKTVAEAEQKLLASQGIERRGTVLGLITKLKQICNHPDQYLGQTAYAAEDSGKFQMLRELCETIRDRHERVLVFTQFREITEYLAAYLEEIFHAKGFVLHGGTRVQRRTEIVDAFQGEQYVPFIVLSVKAGGTGLNLTNANHVIHFDRWWNPAVENQATDRAFRIGQSKNVMVHKLMCEGTIEEKIDELLESKRALAENVIGGTSESWITQLSNDELLDLLRLE